MVSSDDRIRSVACAIHAVWFSHICCTGNNRNSEFVDQLPSAVLDRVDALAPWATSAEWAFRFAFEPVTDARTAELVATCALRRIMSDELHDMVKLT